MENKSYSFEIEGDSEFFKHFEMEAVNGGSFIAKIEVNKSETMINLAFDIKGTLILECDRSLEFFDFPFSTKESVILKFGEHDEDLADGIKLINRNTQTIDLSQEIYELISLTIPMKKLHPRYLVEEDEIENEGFIVYSTLSDDTNKKEDKAIDPRWAILKNLK